MGPWPGVDSDIRQSAQTSSGTPTMSLFNKQDRGQLVATGTVTQNMTLYCPLLSIVPQL